MREENNTIEYKYDAFISYRHTELDVKVAELLHKKIETFKTPKGMKKIERVFRDRDELPTSSNLADSILDALTHSRYLIVICSPRTPLSKWVLKEIEIFRALHGNDRILSILIEGEPSVAFPETLRFVPVSTVDANGNTVEELREIEPLAADIRADSFPKMKKKLNSEILRLLAPIYGCNFDDLKQRHKLRQMRRVAVIFASTSVFLLIFGTYSVRQALLLQDKTDKLTISEQNLLATNEQLDERNVQLDQQNKQLDEQNLLLEDQNTELQDRMNTILTGQSKILADYSKELMEDEDRRTAINLALNALPTSSTESDRPYVAEAEYALSTSLLPYGSTELYTGDLSLKHNDRVKNYKINSDGTYIASSCEDGYTYLWDMSEGKLVNKFYNGDSLNNSPFSFVREQPLIVLLLETKVVLYNYAEDHVIWEANGSYDTVALSIDNSLIGCGGFDNLSVFNFDDGALIYDDSLTGKDFVNQIDFTSDGNIMFVSYEDKYLKALDTNTFETLYSIEYPFKEIVVNDGGFLISYDEKYLLTFSNDYSFSEHLQLGQGSLSIYDLTSGSLVKTITDTNAPFRNPVFNNATTEIFYWMGDDFIRGYDLTADSYTSTLEIASEVSGMYNSIDGTLMATASLDGTIRFYDTGDGTELPTSRLYKDDGIRNFTIGGGLITAATYGGNNINIWDNIAPHEATSIKKNISAQIALVDSSNTYLILSEYYGDGYIYDLTTGANLFSSDNNYGDLTSAGFTADNKHAVFVYDSHLLLIDLATKEVVKERQLEKGEMTYFNTAGNTILTIDSDYLKVSAIDPLTFESLGTYVINEYISDFDLSSDRHDLFLVQRDKVLHIDMDTKITKEFARDDYTPYAYDQAHSLISLVSDNKVLVYNYDSGELVAETVENETEINSISFIPNKAELLISSDNSTLKLLDCKTNIIQPIVTNLGGYINTYLFDQSGHYMITQGISSQSTTLWNLDMMKETAYIPNLKAISGDFSTLIGYDAYEIYSMKRYTLDELIALGQEATKYNTFSEEEKQLFQIPD